MNRYHISANDPKVKTVCRSAFPDYTGIKCEVVFTDKPVDMSSYWDGGSRTYYKVVRLNDCANLEVPSQHPVFDRQLNGAESFEIPMGFVVVAHSIFCGKDMGITIYARPDGSNLLPETSQALSDIEAHTLIAAAAYKSSYGGMSDYRKYEIRRKYGYSSTDIDTARATLQAKGLLDKRNAITTAGRNAIEQHPDRYH